jgi:hypothetical protein
LPLCLPMRISSFFTLYSNMTFDVFDGYTLNNFAVLLKQLQ